MNADAARLLAEVLALSAEQRAHLVAELLASLGPTIPVEARSEDEQLAEIERRSRNALAGSPGIPWADAKAEIQRRIGNI
jgi:putative addiction module component